MARIWIIALPAVLAHLCEPISYFYEVTSARPSGKQGPPEGTTLKRQTLAVANFLQDLVLAACLIFIVYILSGMAG